MSRPAAAPGQAERREPGEGREPGAQRRTGHWGRRLARCALGVTLGVVSGWLTVVLALCGWGVWDLLTGGAGDPFKAAAIFGLMGAIFAAPVAFVVGVPVWLIADRSGLTRAWSGAIAGAVLGVVVSAVAPFLIIILPFVGALSGFLAVRYTNRFLPKTWT